MIRKLILATAAVIALSAGAQAANIVTTTQVAPFGSNLSITSQTGVGSNVAALEQFAGGANVASATQFSVIGVNLSTIFQDSESNANAAAVGQTTLFGLGNASSVTQVP